MLATTPPADLGVPTSHWSLDDLAFQILKDAHYKDMSRSTVGRILAEADLQPHRCRYWLQRHDPDFEAKASMPDTKVSILCNPQNPVGRAWTKEELTRYGEICLKHNVLVLSDEIHCDFISKGSKYVPFATLDNEAVVKNSITYKSVSKSFSLAGMKCAWFFSTNPEVYKATVFHNHADLNTLGMYAAGTHEMEHAMGFGFLELLPAVFFWIALAAWIGTFAGLVLDVMRRIRCMRN